MILVLHDAGNYDSIDSCVLRLVGAGCVSGVSVFAAGPKTASVTKACRDAGVSVGVHLTAPVIGGVNLADHCSTQIEQFTETTGASPNYFDCHCFFLRLNPECYDALKTRFGILPMVQKTDPYCGKAYRLMDKIHLHDKTAAKEHIKKLLGSNGLVFAHVAVGLRPAWSISAAALGEMSEHIGRVEMARWPITSKNGTA
jgi:hypothetical protein